MASSPLCRVSREELQTLALSINPLHYWTLGVTLGFHPKTVYELDKEYGEGALLKILTQWVEQQGECDDVRRLLVEKLKDARLEAESNKLLDVSTSVLGLDDKLLVDLADDVETEEQIETFGLALGFNRAALNRYRETSRQEGRVTSKGTRDMLFDWRQTTDPDTQRSALALALHRSQLVKMATEYLPDIKVQTGSSKETTSAPDRIPALSDRLLADIASAIETPEQVESLGITLGFDRAERIRYQETNRVEGRVTCRGTRDMLYDWRQKVPLSDQRPTLEQALIQSGLVMLAGQHLKETITIESIDLLQITDNFTVGQCRKRLSHCYKTRLCKVQMRPWDKDSFEDVKDIFTVVTMYKKDASGKNLQGTKVTLQGSVDEIFTTKVNGMHPQRIVILAGAGKGKTTAIAKMAHDWAHRIQGSAFEDLPLLFIVKFRKVTKKTSLGQAIIDEYLRDIEGLTPNLLESFIRNNQGLCWILLDGLDEHSGSLNSDDPLDSNIVPIMKSLELPDCRLLVTTRPHLEKDFDQGDLPNVYAKMVIEGFGREQSRDYIDSFFGDDKQKEGLKSYLAENDVINELVSTPLLCSMVCYLWKAKLLEGIDTQTKLFDNIVYYIWEHSKDRANIRTRKQLDRVINQLGEVALNGLLDNSNKLVFAIEDFKNAEEALTNACDLGLVLKSESVQPPSLPAERRGAKTTIEFYHKLAQEHTAGKYLAEKTTRFLMLFGLSKIDSTMKQISGRINEYENLLRFASGTNDEMCSRVMQEILSDDQLSESEQFRILFDCSSESANLRGRVSSLVRKCIRNQRVVLKSPTVYTSIGMKKLPRQLKAELTSVELQRPRLTPPLPLRLAEALHALPHLQELSIVHPTDVHALPHVTSMSSLTLEGLQSTYDDWQWLKDADNMTELHVTLLGSDDNVESQGPSLHLTDGKIKSTYMCEQTLKLFENLSRKTSMKISHLSMEHTHLSEDLTHRLWSCLAAFSSLADLTIKHSSLTFSPRAPTLPSIRSLIVTDISADSYRGLVRSLPGLERIYPLRPDDDIRDIALGLREAGGTLSLLRLNGSDAAEPRVSSETMRALCEAVRGITSLRVVRLWLLVIDEEDLIRLMEACRTVRAMESIYLYHCGSQHGGRLDAHVERVRHPPGSEGGIRVGIWHHGDYYVVYVPHLQ